MDITALHLKTSLLYFYRFKKRYLCVDEVYSTCREKADVLVDTGKAIYEIEIKLNKADIRKEKKKKKHKLDPEKQLGANHFYLCVPTELIDYTKKWIKEVNPKYGLIEFDEQRYIEFKSRYIVTDWNIFLKFRKRATNLHTRYNKHLRKSIIKRLSSAVVNAYIDLLQGINRNEKNTK